MRYIMALVTFVYMLLCISAIQADCDSPDDECWCILGRPELFTPLPCQDRCFQFSLVTANGPERLVEVTNGQCFLTQWASDYVLISGPWNWYVGDSLMTEYSQYGGDALGCRACKDAQ